MSLIELRPRRVEIWRGTIKGETMERWFLTVCDGPFAEEVGDYPSESAAKADAEEWDLPIVVLRYQATNAAV